MNRNTIYFVSLSVITRNNEHAQLFTDVVDTAENETDALGQAIVHLRRNLNDMAIVDFDVFEYEHEKSDRLRDLERTIELTQQTFLNNLDISAITIMQNVHKLLIETNEGREHDMPNKIPAIKLLREHLKPYIGLKGCKEIVEHWIDEITTHRTKTGLINIVQSRLNDNGF
jgi:hypothetical protein